MGIEWYDRIARRNGGYKGRAIFNVIGRSAEEVFEVRLKELLPGCEWVLDAGCGHGEFTLKMAPHTGHITGFDNSAEMIAIAQKLMNASDVHNIEFVYATTKTELPFADGQFDLIYDRRGPTSIIEHSRILRAGGIIIGIHNDVSKVKERLSSSAYTDVEFEEYHDAVYEFPIEVEFSKFLADTPGNPDYTQPAYRALLEQKIQEHTTDGKLTIREHRYIWKAMKR
ncbi:class I SAM-dependent methyltransferase [Paenibacillus sp. 1011MAR3C5]|uniref:class I SAM-dependent methyltransferase n=1 Tax=Paenibacillus sp. 1011MAR3C5 TaxID=1675787 RepID=UPI000E6C6229|nr:class I SAM-dependent methyltransferase [Paenibacillus sp. 1011MAR3C5]RJE90279.1 class I SAM-dependent methyltransferase [Paenibacillus sp. 1011MAR3C5]